MAIRHRRSRVDGQGVAASPPAPAYVELARDLQAAIEARLAMADDDLERSFTEVLKDMGDDALREHVLAMVEQLPADERLRLYGRALRDDGLLAVVAESAQLDRNLVERQVRLQRIRRDALVSHMLDLRNVDAGEVLEIGMFDGATSAPSHAARSARRRTLTVRMRDPSTGTCVKLSETVHAPAFADAPPLLLVDVDVLRLGTELDRASTLEPTLSYGRAADVAVGASPTVRFPEAIGYVLIGTEVVLDRPTT